jgi:glucose/arabinose dehydrogenase
MRLPLPLSGLTVLCFAVVALPLTTPSAVAAQPDKPSHVIASVTVFASGLENPRGLKFGPDGHLYVAEGGTGGSNFVDVDRCANVPTAGPYLGS